MKGERIARVERKTRETEIELTFSLDGTGSYTINTGIPFFNHLLEQFAKHGRFNLELHGEGDIEVDFHHLVEDTGITLGDAFRTAIGDKGGIRRYSTSHVPMDESLVRICVDISGRPYLSYNVIIQNPQIVHFNAGLIEEFFRAFAHTAGITIHVDCLRGSNAHHILEAAFKGFGIALSEASEVLYPDEEVPSTKGVL